MHLKQRYHGAFQRVYPCHAFVAAAAVLNPWHLKEREKWSDYRDTISISIKSLAAGAYPISIITRVIISFRRQISNHHKIVI